MPIIFGKAPGKIILFGEHAVVYGQPAIAIPVTMVNATARVTPNLSADSGLVRLEAADIGLDADLSQLPEDHPLAAAVRTTLHEISPNHTPACTIQVHSTIPISAGMGSGAAVTVAIIRALSAFLGKPLPEPRISELAYEIEKLHHGTPSGIDNTVVTYQKPVYFKRDQPLRTLAVENPTFWVIADTGEKTSTKETVTAVRQMHAADPAKVDAVFAAIGNISDRACEVLIQGNLPQLGHLMDENQRLLTDLQVSSEKLETLIHAARQAGAAGAKLSGGGRGGNMIALAAPENIEKIKDALVMAGAVQVLTTLLRKEP